MELKKKTAGKRRARPGSPDVDVLNNRKVGERTGVDTAGRKSNRTTRSCSLPVRTTRKRKAVVR